MINTIINVKEAYDMGLNLGEINAMVGSIYEALHKEAVAKQDRFAQAKQRVVDGSYKQEDLDILAQNMKDKSVAAKIGVSPKPAKDPLLKSWLEAERVPKKIKVTELEDWIKSLGAEPPTFF